MWKGGEVLKQKQIENLKQSSSAELAQLTKVIVSAIEKYQHMPTLLASNSRVIRVLEQRSPLDIQQLNAELAQISRITEASESYIIAPTGVTIAASNFDQDTSFIGKDFSFRPYFKQAMAGLSGRYYALGTTTNRRGYYFSYPVKSKQSIIGVAVVKVDLSQFESRLKNNKFNFLLLDPDGIVFSSSRKEWLYKTINQLSHEELQRIVESRRYKTQAFEKLPIVAEEAFDDDSDLLQLLDVKETLKGEEKIDRISYLHLSSSIYSLGFKVDLLIPITLIEEEIALWRTIFMACLMILILVLITARLRRRMLSERSQALEMSRHNQAYIREIINNTQAGLITLDAEQKVESYNPAMETLIGHSLTDLIGVPFHHLYQPFSGEPGRQTQPLFDNVSGPLNVTASEGVLNLYSDEGVHDFKQVPVEMTLCKMNLPNSLKYLVTFHDMTERKQYEQELMLARNALEHRVVERTSELELANQRLRDEIQHHKETQQELIQTAKLAVLGQLSAGINHELNQPLTAMRAFAENGLTFIERENIPQAKGNLSKIVGLCSHMSDIISRFKVFARKGKFQHSAVSLDTVLQGAMTIMMQRLKECEIECILPDIGEEKVMGDVVLLEQVLVNLIANAIDAIMESEHTQNRIELVIEALDSDKGKSASWLTIKVRDTGNGMDDQVLASLFEPFFTSKADGVGLGLGLSISQRIVESMGGRISACNITQRPHSVGHKDVNIGAEFSVTLKAVSFIKGIS
ncbi:C4-dicarboxylate transport sensor protein [Marinomonas sp. MED121]|uniref:ATP-binding protein n=1 Tax=Marinomonas sp. MED121 TaxID=314277 RepID=UPI000069108F|nr:ATP-binding protein [Marinomonas sp. MED121]EAQ67808.1 C4-dicarboxylate transport sensor protein [Marinomonas sp. MED121]